MDELTMAQKVALYGGGGLVLLGTVVIGLLEMLVGSSHPVSGEGQIVHEALVPLKIRSYMILLGFILWGIYALYRTVSSSPATGPSETL